MSEQQTLTGSRNFAYGPGAAKMLTTGSCNICIGDDAGAELTSESYQFCIRGNGFPGVELRTTMTHEEWEVVHRVAMRAINAFLNPED